MLPSPMVSECSDAASTADSDADSEDIAVFDLLTSKEDEVVGEAGDLEVAEVARRRGSQSTICSSDIRPHILRGTRISRVMTVTGFLLWSASPMDMSWKSKEKLWRLSRRCDELDYFISHAWGSPGWQKYLALLTHFHRRRAETVGWALALVFFLLDVCGVLPTIEGKNIIVVRYCPWAALPPMVSILVMLLSPYWASRSESRAFLDKTCIHQSDHRLKVEGIYCLPGFLAKSRELLILWSPVYLTRLWCVFEVAMFTATNPSGVVTWCPPFLHFLFFVLFCTWIFMVGCEGVLNMSNTKVSTVATVTMFAVQGISFYLCNHFLRRCMWDKRQLITQLEGFSARLAECRDEKDKEHILRSIEHWYGTEQSFDESVRGPLKELAVKSTRKAFEANIVDSFHIAWPQVCAGAQWIAAYARAGIPPPKFACFSIAVVLQYMLTVPFVLKAVFLLTDFFARPCSCFVGDIAINILILVIVNICGCVLWFPPDLPSGGEESFLWGYNLRTAALVTIGYSAVLFDWVKKGHKASDGRKLPPLQRPLREHC